MTGTTERLALGTAQWGQPYGIANRTGQPSRVQIQEIFDLARAAGIRTIDTARAYGTSEELVGDLLAGDPEWLVTTKLDPRACQDAQDPEDAVRATEASITSSQRALRTTTLDVVLLHRAMDRIALNGAVWEFLCRLRDEGSIKALGISVGTPEEAFGALECEDVALVQVATSLFDQRLVRAGFFEHARACGKEVHVRSVFLQGAAFLEPASLPAPLSSLADPLRSVGQAATAHGCSIDQVFLLFARELGSDRVILGCESAPQLGGNLITWQGEAIPDSVIREVAEAVPDLPEHVLNPARWGRSV